MADVDTTQNQKQREQQATSAEEGPIGNVAQFPNTDPVSIEEIIGKIKIGAV